jgi:hypothetical protein
MSSAAFYDRSTGRGSKLVNLFGSGRKRNGKPDANSLAALPDQFGSPKGDRRGGAGDFIASFLSSFGVVMGEADDPRDFRRAASMQDPLPDVPVQEGTTETPTSVLIRLREFAQSLSAFPDDPPGVFATFRELMQSLPPLPDSPPPVFSTIREFVASRTTPYPEPPRGVFSTLRGYIRSLRPRGKG